MGRTKRGKKIPRQSEGHDNPSNSPFKFIDSIKICQDIIYAIKFMPLGERKIFAVALKGEVQIFEALEDSTQLLKTFKDEYEYFFSLDWSVDEFAGNCPVLVAGGELGVIRIFVFANNRANNLTNNQLKKLDGHNAPVNDLKFKPKNPSIFASASADFSVRLWNIHQENYLVKIFSPQNIAQIISLNFNQDGDLLYCGDLANKLYIYNLKEVQQSLGGNNNEIANLMEPAFCTREVHTNYIDSISTFQGVVFTRSSSGDIQCWKPKNLENDKTKFDRDKFERISMIRPKTEERYHVWFIRMSLDTSNSLLAVGDVSPRNYGNIEVWDLRSLNHPNEINRYELSHQRSCHQIYMTSFAPDSSVLVGCSKDGCIIRYDSQTSSLPPVKIEPKDEEEDEPM